MSFTFVRIPRWMLQHLVEGKLTFREFTVLNILWHWADHRTGGGEVNAPTLLYRLGHDEEFGRSRDGAMQAAWRVLRSLHTKGYIWYRGKPGPKVVQRYWLHGYPLGIKDSCRCVDLTHLREKEIVTYDDILRSVGQVNGQVNGQMTGQVNDKNKKTRTQEYKNQDNPYVLEKSQSLIDTKSEDRSFSEASTFKACDAHESNVIDSLNASRTDSSSDSRSASSLTHVNRTRRTDTAVRRFRMITGSDAHYTDADTGQRLPWIEANQLLASGNAVEVTQ